MGEEIETSPREGVESAKPTKNVTVPLTVPSESEPTLAVDFG